MPTNLSDDRREVLNKIELYEQNGWFDKDVEEDPETIILMPDDIEYINRTLKSKLVTKLANKGAIKFYEKLIKQKQFIIEDVVGIENVLNIKTGKVITCNHFSVFDNYAVYRPLKQRGLKQLYKVIREGNYTTYNGPFAYFMKRCNTLPLSSNTETMKKFFKSCKELLNRGETILIYPEQAMWYNYRKPRPLKTGAFKIAVSANVPVIPTFITMRDSDILDNDGNYVQIYTIHYLEPIFPKEELSNIENCEYMKDLNYKMWVELYEKVYNEKLSYKK